MLAMKIISTRNRIRFIKQKIKSGKYNLRDGCIHELLAKREAQLVELLKQQVITNG